MAPHPHASSGLLEVLGLTDLQSAEEGISKTRSPTCSRAATTTPASRAAQPGTPGVPPPKTTLPPVSGQLLSGLRGGSHPFNLLLPIRVHQLQRPRLHPSARARPPLSSSPAGAAQRVLGVSQGCALLTAPSSNACAPDPRAPSEWRTTPLHVCARAPVNRLDLLEPITAVLQTLVTARLPGGAAKPRAVALATSSQIGRAHV